MRQEGDILGFRKPLLITDQSPLLHFKKVGRQTGFEPATPSTTNQWKYRQLTYHPNWQTESSYYPV
jgi:hypothetical protein